MAQITLSDLKAHTGQFVLMAQNEDVYITKNGKRVAKLTSVNTDRISAAKSLFGILPDDVDYDKLREEKYK